MKTILDYIIENKKNSHISFCAPGHKGRTDILDRTDYGEFYHNMLTTDIPDTRGRKDAARLIKSTEGYYADLYGVKESRLLTGGSGSGVSAAILSHVPIGGKLILGRMQSDAVFNTLRIGEILPVYLDSEFNEEWGVYAGISPAAVRKACQDNPDATAILIQSPTDYGAISDIQEISGIAHRHNMILIVDQTYGAHLKFFDAINDTTNAAEDLGADIVIEGTDQNLLSVSGTGVLNICSDRVNIDALDTELDYQYGNSYLALGSLDINEKVMRRYGGDIVTAWIENLNNTYRKLKAIPGLDIIAGKAHDATKIAVSLSQYGVTGGQLARELVAGNVAIERIFGNYVLCQTGAGNIKSDYQVLINIASHIAEIYGVYGVEDRDSSRELGLPDFELDCTLIPKVRETVPLFRAEGRTIYEPIVVYPSALKVACPGEVINIELIGYIKRALENGNVIEGVDEEGYIIVG